MFEQHRETLEKALSAIAERGYWSAYPESPSPRVYGEGAAERGKEAFESYLGKPFPLDQPGTGSWIGAERSPYGIDLGVTYPEQPRRYREMARYTGADCKLCRREKTKLFLKGSK
ncbi:hypothetical protein AB0J09_52745, partial [Nonomuraea sp. NPDC049784]